MFLYEDFKKFMMNKKGFAFRDICMIGNFKITFAWILVTIFFSIHIMRFYKEIMDLIDVL